jgi:hypothetical protein
MSVVVWLVDMSGVDGYRLTRGGFMRRVLRHKKLSLLGFVAVLALTGSAVAYFTGGGSGSGTAAVGTSGSVALTATVPAGILPGISEPVTFTAANATSSPIRVSNVHLVGVSVDSGHAACLTTDFTMPDVTEADQVAAGATAQTLSGLGTLSYANTAVSQDACKGATLTLTLTSS